MFSRRPPSILTFVWFEHFAGRDRHVRNSRTPSLIFLAMVRMFVQGFEHPWDHMHDHDDHGAGHEDGEEEEEVEEE